MISIVFPAFNEEKNVKELYQKIVAVMSRLKEPYEIIAVENGSRDGTLNALKSLPGIKIVVIAKNIGQTAGLDAGIKNTHGDIVVTLDSDLQNDPEDIPRLVSKIREGYDVVSGWRLNRKDSFGRKVLSRLANWLTYRMTGLYLHDSACALKAYRKKVLDDVNLYGEMHVFLPAILYGRGAKVIEVEVKHHARVAGASKHSFMKAVKDIGDLLVIKFMADYMSRPFIFFGGWGAFSIFLGLISGGTSVVLKLMEIRNIGETPLPVLTVLFIVVGVVLVMMGFLAEIILRTYYETKGKTPYVVKDVIENK